MPLINIPRARPGYRPEIDGLRALAVIGVILFHAGFGFPGGYVGVDVFFFISGYLISGIIAREVQSGTFTFAKFWTRRVKRIMPASVAMVFAVLAVGLIVLDPISLVTLGKTAIANACMASNVYFYRSVGYFSESADLNPLLHTWSLAVEEQYYLVFPILFIFLHKFFKNGTHRALAWLFALSFVLSWYGVHAWPGATFFLLPTRAWELLAGSLLAVSNFPSRHTRMVAEIMSAGGLIMILASMFIYDAQTTFPGLAALLPVIGAGAFIAGNRSNLTTSGRLLASAPFVGIGLISYSLYLWHWPFLAFARHLLIDVTVWHRLALTVCFVAIAYLSWRFIETPFRSPTVLAKPRGAFTFATLSSTAIVVVCGALLLLRGLPGRLDERALSQVADMAWTGAEYQPSADVNEPVPIGAKNPHVTPSFVLWGDSHGGAACYAIDQICKVRGLTGVVFVTVGQVPVTGVWKPTKKAKSFEETTSESAKKLEWILKSGIKNLILVGRWDAICSGVNNVEIQHDGNITDVAHSMVSDSEILGKLNAETSSTALGRQLKQMTDTLSTAGVHTWILQQSPEIDKINPVHELFLHTRFPVLNPTLDDRSTSLTEYRARQRLSVSVLAKMIGDHVTVIDPTRFFYPDGDRLLIFGKKSFYWDDDHLTREGAQYYLKPVFEEVFAKMNPAGFVERHEVAPRN